jgi:small subunit ribosomal protein S6
MRRYETFLIIDPDLSQDQREPLTGRVEELIAQMDGFLISTDDWGERKLAYDIKKKRRGYYVRFDFCGLAPLVNEIERFFRIDDRALKYMTVLLNKDADLEKIKEEKTAKETAAAEKAAKEAAATETAAPESAAQETAATDTAAPTETAAEEAAAKETAAKEAAATETAAKEAAATETAAAEKAAKEAAATETAAAEKTAVETTAAETPSDPDNAPEEVQEKESAPAEEKAKTGRDVPASEPEDSAPEKTPSSTKEEA